MQHKHRKMFIERKTKTGQKNISVAWPIVSTNFTNTNSYNMYHLLTLEAMQGLNLISIDLEIGDGEDRESKWIFALG